MIYFVTIFAIGGMLSFFIIIIETFLLYSFTKFAFENGITAFERTIEIPTNNIKQLNDLKLKRKEGKFYFSPNNRIYFLSRFRIFSFRLNTPFPFKGTGVINKNNTITIIGKLPLGTTLFISFFLLAVISATIIFPPIMFVAIAPVLLIPVIGIK
ncbi:hypothetical protein [Chondrinema litorale]|uniref:hypothetical protein n=1 Tax=Chondrinema litorale TaxID=2994555 RepID=UPI002543DFE6|nr:hypothetical protein [Chondrinema litorale]UZR97320.1 hypothetical protein OQ292_25805 [Chondrinema litorale]